MQAHSGITVFSTAIFIPILVLGLLQIFGVRGSFVSPAVHLVFLLMVMISGLFFWGFTARGFRITGSFRTLLIALGLTFAGFFYFGYGLFFNEYSSHLGFSDGRAEWYLRYAGVILSLTLLIAVGFSERIVKLAARRRILALTTALFVALLILSIFIIESAVGADIHVAATAGRWTPLGRFLQISTIMFFTVAAIRYLYGAFLIRSEIALACATGAVFFVMSELTYALTQEPYDVFFWASRLWLVMGYFAFVWGGYASQITHHEEGFSPKK